MTTSGEGYEHERVVAIRAVREAARLCRAVGAEIAQTALSKSDQSPVTVADFGSQALICRTLGAAFPADPVIAEEDAIALSRPENAAVLGQVVRHVRAVRAGAGAGNDDRLGASISAGDVRGWIDRGGTGEYVERFWTIDPIDGTKGFLRGEQFAVALALIVDGEVVVAALACPNLTGPQSVGAERAGLILWAVRGGYAFAAADAGRADVVPAGERVCVSKCDDTSWARLCESVESGHSAHGDAAAVADRLGIVAPPLRLDSQAKYAVVARGDAEIYLRMPTRADYREKIWDHAAGALIVSEAGGTVTDIDGHPLDFRHGRELTANRGVLVTNGRLHPKVVRAIAAQRST